jgi:hypothetical protein
VIDRHVGRGLFDYVLANNHFSAPIPQTAPASIPVDGAKAIPVNKERPLFVFADVVDHENGYRHDPKRLGEAIMRVYYDRGDMPVAPASEREPAAAEA